MAARNITPTACSMFALFGIKAIYALCFCLTCCLLFVIRRCKARTPVLDAEKSLSGPWLGEHGPKYPAQHRICPAATKQDSPFTKGLNPCSKAEYIQPPPFTSGYFAAKADIETDIESNTQLVPRASKQASLGQSTPARNLQATISSIFEEDQQAPWRRHSYPLDQDRGGAALHEDAKHDETRHFCDDHDPAIIWRRRTMTFQGKGRSLES